MNNKVDIMKKLYDEIKESFSKYICKFNNEDNFDSYENSINDLLKRYNIEDLKFKVTPHNQSKTIMVVSLYYKEYKIINYSLFNMDDIIMKLRAGDYDINIQTGELSLSNDVLVYTFKIDLNNEDEKLLKLIEWLKGKRCGYFLEDKKTWINYGSLEDKFPYNENNKKWELGRNHIIERTISEIEKLLEK